MVSGESSVAKCSGQTPLELEAVACSFNFDASELRWVRDGEGSSTRVGFTRREGIARLIIGSREVLLADVAASSLAASDFIALDIREVGQVGLKFESDAQDARRIFERIRKAKADYERFDHYDPSSVQSYFQYYGKLGNQQNMLQDQVRTNAYQRAITENPETFRGAKVMDVGAGSGILSFFAAQAGAGLVYAVEASSMSEVVAAIASGNNFGNSKIEVVGKTLEKISDEVSGKVDILVSEPIGTFLFNERMIETYLCARDRFLRPGGKMFPNAADLCIAPFTDTTLYWEQQNKNTFWKNTSFYGLDITPAMAKAQKEQFRQPIVDYINPECLVAKATSLRFDFLTVSAESLRRIEIPFKFQITQPCLVHGLGGWFDAHFEHGSQQKVTLSTAPWSPGTHWYQIRFLLETPVAVNAGQFLEGVLEMDANNLQSYFVRLKMGIEATKIAQENMHIDLKDPEYRFYTSPNSYCPPGTANAWSQNAGTAGSQSSAPTYPSQSGTQGQPQTGAGQQQYQNGGYQGGQYQSSSQPGSPETGTKRGYLAATGDRGANGCSPSLNGGDNAKHRRKLAQPNGQSQTAS